MLASGSDERIIIKRVSEKENPFGKGLVCRCFRRGCFLYQDRRPKADRRDPLRETAGGRITDAQII